MKYLVRKSIVRIVGVIWLPAVNASLVKELSSYDVDNMRDDQGKLTRESVDRWVALNSGDFQHVIDWDASIEDGDQTVDIPFATEEGESAYLDTLEAEE